MRTGGATIIVYVYCEYLPLISSLDHIHKWTNVWYIDDATACMSIDSSREWFCLMRERDREDLHLVTFLSHQKVSWCLTTNTVLRAKEVFASVGVNVV